MYTSPLSVLARTLRGVEWIASAEVRARLRTRDLQQAHREIRFSLPTLTRELLDLGTVDDVFLIAMNVDGVGRDRADLRRLAAAAKAVDLDRLVAVLGVLGTSRPRRCFDVVGSFVGKRNYSRYEIEDAVGQTVASSTGWIYCPRSPGTPAQGGLSLRVHLADSHATIAARIGPTPLHRRQYRVASRPGSLHPPLARALALLAGLRPGASLIDPFCGAGTVPIEAKLACPALRAAGFDLEPKAIATARRNAIIAAVDAQFALADAAGLPLDGGTADRVATNPPWGSAVAAAGRLQANSGALPREVSRVLAPGGRVSVLVPPHDRGNRLAPTFFDVLLESRVRVSGAIADLVVLGRPGDDVEPIDPLGLYGRQLVEELAVRQPFV